MQLVEAVILLLLGMVPGVWMAFADVYAVGASAFSAHASVWIMLVVLLSCNARYRRQAVWCAIWLSLGYIETYYLCSSFTFAGLARSHVVPLALLGVVGGVVAAVGWAAKRERGIFGLALRALVVVGTLVACVATHDGISALDVFCTAVIVYTLFAMRSRRVAMVPHREEAGQVVRQVAGQARELAGESQRSARQASSVARPQDARPSQPQERKGQKRRPTVETTPRRSSSAPAKTGSRKSVAASGAAKPTRGTAKTGTKRTGTASAPARKSPSGSPRRSGSTRARTQRPTRRTGGAVPEANRIRSSASDRRSQRDERTRRTSSSARRR